MIKSNLCDYSDAYKLVKGSITFVGQGAHTAAIVNDRNNKNVIFKNCDHLLTASVKKKTQLDNTNDIDFLVSMYNIIEYSDNYAKTL